MLKLCILCLLCPFHLCAFVNMTRRWKADLENSLKQNLIISTTSKCKAARYSTFKQFLLSNSSISLLSQFPTASEIREYQSTPNTLEFANKDLHQLAAKNGYTYEWQRSNDTRWMIPSDHPGQDKVQFMRIAAEISAGKIVDLYASYKSDIQGAMYLLKIQNGVVHPSGVDGMQCGYYAGMDGCETRWNQARSWWHKCNGNLKLYNLPWSSYSTARRDQYEQRIKQCTLKGSVHEKQPSVASLYDPFHVGRVFVASALWDYNYNHFLTDSLARIVRNIRFLRTNKDVKIHIRQYEEYDTMYRDDKFKGIAKRMRNKLFTLLGIGLDRIVYGVVIADEVFLPRNMHCAYALKNPLEIRRLARELLQTAHHRQSHKNPQQYSASSSRPIMLIQQRFTPYGSGDRTWNDNTLKRVVEAFASQYSKYEIVTLNSTDIEADTYCLECEIALYARATILVGAHGAGLTNQMFMPPGSYVIEITGHVLDVSMPWCGYYGPTAAIFGHHHYVYAYDHGLHPLNATDAAVQSKNFHFYTNPSTLHE